MPSGPDELEFFENPAEFEAWLEENADVADEVWMRPRGLGEVEKAKADGRWDAAYDSPKTATVPDDLAAALDAAGARGTFDALNAQNRYAVLHRVQKTTTPAGRAKAIARLVALVAAGGKLHP